MKNNWCSNRELIKIEDSVGNAERAIASEDGEIRSFIPKQLSDKAAMYAADFANQAFQEGFEAGMSFALEENCKTVECEVIFEEGDLR